MSIHYGATWPSDHCIPNTNSDYQVLVNNPKRNSLTQLASAIIIPPDMAPLPKKRHSRGRQGKRRAAISFTLPTLVKCTNCTSLKLPHQVCPACGFYRGKMVTKVADTVRVSKTSNS